MITSRGVKNPAGLQQPTKCDLPGARPLGTENMCCCIVPENDLFIPENTYDLFSPSDWVMTFSTFWEDLLIFNSSFGVAGGRNMYKPLCKPLNLEPLVINLT